MSRTFNGTSDYIDCGDIDALDGVSQLSIAVWVKPSSLADFRVVAEKMDVGRANGFSFQMSGAGLGTNNDVYLAIRNAGTDTQRAVTTSNLLAAGVYGHWLMVYDGTASLPAANRLKFYFNGTAIGLSFGATNPPATMGSISDPLIFGRASASASLYWPGDLAEPAIWTVPLTAAEAVSLAAGFSSLLIRPASLEFYSTLGGKHSPEIDRIGGRSLTLTGTAAAAHPRVFSPRGVEQVFVPAAVGGGGTALLPHMMEQGLFVGAHGA